MLSFFNLNYSGNRFRNGPLLDNVTVTTAVPEPENYAMMLAGPGLIGLIARRRRQG